MPVLLSFAVNFGITGAILSISWSQTAKCGTFNNFPDIPGLFDAVVSISGSNTAKCGTFINFLDILGLFEIITPVLLLLARNLGAPVAPVAPAAPDMLFFLKHKISEAPAAQVAPAVLDMLLVHQNRYSTLGIVSKAFIVFKNFLDFLCIC